MEISQHNTFSKRRNRSLVLSKTRPPDTPNCIDAFVPKNVTWHVDLCDASDALILHLMVPHTDNRLTS